MTDIRDIRVISYFFFFVNGLYLGTLLSDSWKMTLIGAVAILWLVYGALYYTEYTTQTKS